MSGVPTPKATVTPKVDKESLITQMEEQITVLYSPEGTLWEKETAALNLRLLINYYHSLFNVLPELSKERGEK